MRQVLTIFGDVDKGGFLVPTPLNIGMEAKYIKMTRRTYILLGPKLQECMEMIASVLVFLFRNHEDLRRKGQKSIKHGLQGDITTLRVSEEETFRVHPER